MAALSSLRRYKIAKPQAEIQGRLLQKFDSMDKQAFHALYGHGETAMGIYRALVRLAGVRSL